MLKDSEQEVRSCAILKLPELGDHLNENVLQVKLVPILAQLASDASLHVRLSLSQALSKLAAFYDSNFFLTSIIPIFQTLFKDEITEVRIALIENIKYLAQLLSTDQIKTHVIPLLLNIAQDKQWRAKLALLETMPEVCKELGYEVFKSELSDFLKGFCFDHVQAIRDQAIQDLCQLHKSFGASKMDTLVEAIMDELITSGNYLFRITALHALKPLRETFSKQQIISLLNKCVNTMGEDRVPNVKFNLVKTSEGVMDFIQSDPKLKNSFCNVLKKFKEDEDSDVCYFAATALEKHFS